MAGGLTALAAGALVVRLIRDPAGRRRTAGWGLAGVAVLAAVWAAPVIDQVTGSPGNLTLIWETFSDPVDPPVGLGRGAELLFAHLNPVELLGTGAAIDGSALNGSVVPGAVLLVVWVIAAAAAWRLGRRSLVALHATIGASVLLGVIAASRIYGYVWYYLLLWAWGITALMVLAVGWTIAAAVAGRVDPPLRRRWATTGAVALLAATVVSSALYTLDAPDAEVPDAQASATLSAVAGPTVLALEQPGAVGGGPDGRYLVTWRDPLNIGSQGYGLLLELERNGFDVGTPDQFDNIVRDHRVFEPGEYTGVVHLAVGPAIDEWRTKPGVTEVAYTEPRNAAERAEYAEVRADVIAGLRAEGLADLVDEVDENTFLAAFDPRLPEDLKDQLTRLVDLGRPVAVFVGPPGAAG